ncbi:alkaline phosphatase family protein [Leekyejoonella antrihumi]|uniref:Alkaline phosphatase family protein n=1 Tax=Leekyejoonella antrihumi TaxID=1660198 RepID=A0A563E3F7_9MICO|nr:nucleotide pyrophosphatase/phosphodiesterase family protein [Leekyejoonella antrihumi]TWP36945.1 alkaline phosphatase family protein [Leekyejoonella antrihumi]
MPGPSDGPAFPAYDERGLAGVLPRVAASLGVALDGYVGDLPPARRAVVVLVDGLGLELLRARSGHAPFLRRLLRRQQEAPDPIAERLTAGFPATTATSMGSFGTGLPPGSHGLVGYQVRVPGTDRLLNELSWQDGPVPEQWQPEATWFQRADRAGVAVTMIAPGKFDGSGLTRAALRGARFKGAEPLGERVDLALAALRADPRALAYLYWGDVDRIGHRYGCGSWQWGDAVEEVDRELQRLADGLPAGTSLTITADHGMVDVAADARVDLAHDPELAEGVLLAGGEMRALQLYCRAGAAADVLTTWRHRFGSQAWVLSRDEAVQAGLFGPVHERVLPRLGDVVVAMRAPIGVYDSRVMARSVTTLIGQHGSLTDAEQSVPMLHVPVS